MAAQVAEELKTVTYSTPPMEELRKKERIHFNVFIIPFRKFGPPYLGKATAATRAAPPSPTVYAGSFHVSVIHRTRTWTTGSFTCVRT